MEAKLQANIFNCPVCRTCDMPKSGSLKNGFYATTCENCGHFFKFKTAGPLKSSVAFTINGKSYTVGNQYAAALSLNEFMRSQGISYGTKQMCIEGGCGVCLVTTTLYDPINKKTQTYSVNSCLLPLYTCDGMQVTTVEGLGSPRDGLHPIQDRLAQYNGSQCGFCSPAQVMNMYGTIQVDLNFCQHITVCSVVVNRLYYLLGSIPFRDGQILELTPVETVDSTYDIVISLLKRNTTPTMQQIEDAFDVSICRCTGYRSILDAMKSFASDAPPHLPGGAIDIEEIDKKICSKTGQACTGRCSSQKRQQGAIPLHLVLQGAQWYKPTTRQELYSLLGQHKGDNYRLVFGNSGFGVYKEIRPWEYDVLIDLRGIQDFYGISVDPSSNVMFGSSITLNNLQETFETYSNQSALPYFRDFAQHLSVVANTGVRNLASFAGNLMLKHLHTEFPSDIFTMFEAVGAKLFIGSSDGTEKQYNLMDFLNLDMHGKVILSVELPTYSTGDVYFRSFKITPRHQNAHAYVNAAFNMRLDKTNNFTVKTKPSIVYGGINKTLVHANKTEAFLVGKQLGDPAVLKGALASLSTELVPDTTAGLSSITYRKNLSVCLFYKFVLGICGEKAATKYKSGGTNLIRPLSSGTQTYDTHSWEWPLTKPVTRVEAAMQTSGRLQYINDVPPMPGELYASFVISSVGNAEIDTVDTSSALAYPGVLKYISASDIPAGGVNSFMPALFMVEEVFSSGKITYSGQPIGLLVAVDKISADIGASMVRVTYKNVQPPILTIEDALQKGSVIPSPGVWKELKVGDAADAIAKSDKKITGSVSLGHQYHFHMETQVSISYPEEDGIGISLLSATQWDDFEQIAVARFLNVPENRINVETRRIGGSFGGKVTRPFLPACASALAAIVMRRPVRLAMNFHTNMKTIGGRYPYLVQYQVGVTTDGKLNGIQLTVNADMGNTANDTNLGNIPKWIDNAYYCPAWDYKPVAVKTNLPSHTFCRSPGSTEAIFIMETMMDHVAKDLGKDPLDVRKLNLYNKGQTTPNGMVLQYCDIRNIVNQLETSAAVQARKQQIAAFNKANRWKKKGLSVQPLRWNLDSRTAVYNVFVTVYHGDGSVAIALGGVDQGQGLNTKMIQVCAYELGIPMDNIQIKGSSTLANANSWPTGGSITGDVNGMGVIDCCNQLKARMAPVKAKMTNPTWQQLVSQCYNQGIDLTARAYPRPDGDQYDYNVYGASCTEVELDVLTGENQINRVDILYDCGESMNPELDIGQAEGGFVMGLGYWLTEKLYFDPKTGVNITDGTWEYKPPMAKDIPIDFRIKLMKNHPNQRGVLRSKSAGEPPMCMASSALFAIKHAIEAARKDAATDTFFPLNGPATVEVVQSSCQTDINQLVYGT